MRVFLLALAAFLSACTLTLYPEGLSVTYRVDFGGAILRFEPDRGRGATYFVGEEVRFFLTLDRPGWVSLVVQDPDGYTYELDRFHLSRGTHVLPPGPYRYTLTPPRGLHRVRAVYTQSPPQAGSASRAATPTGTRGSASTWRPRGRGPTTWPRPTFTSARGLPKRGVWGMIPADTLRGGE